MTIDEAKKIAFLTGIKSFLATQGERGAAFSALMDELKDASLESVAKGHSLVGDGAVAVGCVELVGLLHGYPVTIALTMEAEIFDSIWTRCNVQALLPKPELVGGAQ